MVRSWSVIRPASRRLRKVKSGLYLAPVGQIEQVSQRTHSRRPRQGREFLETGFRQ